MLKLTYTEFGLHLERVDLSIEELVAQRVVLALRLGKAVTMQPSRAAFLLPIDAVGLKQFQRLIGAEGSAAIAIAPVDDEFVEVGLQGCWIAETADAEEGMFVAALGDRLECAAYKLWQATQGCIAVA